MQTELIKNEILAIANNAEQVLFENHKFVVVSARANELTYTLPHIGKLREQNFQMVGEGTGQEVDLDKFDQLYVHIIAWNKKNDSIAGAARLGEISDLYQKYGRDGIYSCLEFEFSDELFEHMTHAIELSRLFVNATDKKNYFGLYLIFTGVSNWLAKNRYYTHILGSVSISKAIPTDLHALIIEFCRRNYYDNHLSKYIKAFKPADFPLSKTIIEKLDKEQPKTFDELNQFIETHYGLKNQIPILFKKYHLFESKYVAFGIDDDFSSVTDPLLYTDFAGSSKEVLTKFINKTLLPDYLEHFGRS